MQHLKTWQIECGIPLPLKLVLHSNTHWGSALKMLKHNRELLQVSIKSIKLYYISKSHWFLQLLKLFLSSADELFGLIMTGPHSSWMTRIGSE